MRNGFLGSLGTLLASAGLAFAQPLPSAAPAPPAQPSPPATAPKVDTPAQPGPAAPGVTGDPHVVPDPHGPPHSIPLLSGPESGMPPAPYEKPYCGELENEHDVDFWVGGEFLMWWPKQAPAPIPLVTTGPPGSFGILGTPGVKVVNGVQEMDLSDMNGARITFGMGVPQLGVGVESTSFLFWHHTATFTALSDPAGNPTLARPVINSNTGKETSTLIASPGAFSGRVEVESTVQMWGSELNIVRGRFATDCFCADWIAGFRYLGVEEGLTIGQSSTLLAAGTSGFNGDITLAPSVVTIGDVFKTRNEFYGGQVGLQGELEWHGAFVYAMGKVALGDDHESLEIAGGSTRTLPTGITQAVPGGLLALKSNIGVSSRDVFAVVPEANVNIGYQITKHLRAYVGYSFLYVSDVLRPGDQLSRSLNPTQIPTSLSFGPVTGAPQPLLNVQHTDYWAHGLNVGFVFRY